MGGSFVHLHNHSMYSVLDGNQTVESIVERAKELNQFAACVTDHGAMGSMVKLEDLCREEGLDYVHGSEVYVAKDMEEKDDTRYHLVLLALNNKGLRNLIRLTSLAWLEGFYRKPRIDLNLLKEYREGLVVMSACTSGLVSSFILKEDIEQAKKICKWFQKYFGQDFYLELMPLVGREDKEGKRVYNEVVKANKGLLEIGQELGISFVATNDCHYSRKEDEYTQDILLCIQSKKKIDDPTRWRFDLKELYMKSESEMVDSFKQHHSYIPEKIVDAAINNSSFIAFACETAVFRRSNWLPNFEVPKGLTQLDFIKQLLKKGWNDKLVKTGQIKKVARKKGLTEKEVKELYKARLDRELESADTQGFINYFLIVWDLYNWVLSQDIQCGPGRGSSAGSLVCFLLNITQVDPMEYDLLFERFITPGRITSPDIDMDFQDDKRDLIKQYLAERWGADNVVSIGTYGTLKGKQALKDVGRVFGVPYQETQKVCDLVIQRATGDARFSFTLEDTLEQFDYPKEYNQKHPDVFDNAAKLEGRIRQRGMHACGVLALPEPIIDIIPLEKYKGEIITALTWQETDEIGMLKLDILGLSTLTIIKRTLDLIEERTGEKIDIYKLPTDDPEVFKAYKEGKTVGVFQLDSIGASKMCTEAPMECMDDLIAVNALYRPGAMRSGLAGEYIRRKSGRPYKKGHPIVDKITEPTEGCMLYQEQVMAIMRDMALWEPDQVDRVRKLVGKSEGLSKMLEFKQDFLDGCVNNPAYMEGLTEEEKVEPERAGDRIYNSVLHFGSYGFNKSHSTCYATISYWTMWLKIHYPSEFFSVLLSKESDDGNVRRFINEMKAFNIKLLPPDINKSKAGFTLEEGGIRAGLEKVKNVGENAINSIVENSPYKDFDDFVARVNRRVVNRKVIANLIKVGAFSEWFDNRADLLVKWEDIAGKKGKSIHTSTASAKPWTDMEMIRAVTDIFPIPTEKHIIEYYPDVMSKVFRKIIKAEDIEEHSNKVVYMAGTIQDIKYNRVGDFDTIERSEEEKANSDFGQRYANINLEDVTGYRRHKFSTTTYKQFQKVLEQGDGTPVIIKSRADKSRDINYILDITELDDFRERLKEGGDLTPFQKSLVVNPLEEYQEVREALGFPYLDKAEGRQVKLMGELVYLREYNAKNGLMAFLGIEDETGSLDIMVWADAYAAFKKKLKLGNLLAIRATRVKDGKYAVDYIKGDKIVTLNQLKRKLEKAGASE